MEKTIKAKGVMMNKLFISLLLCFVVLSPLAIAAQNVNDLVDQGKLSISINIVQEEQQIVGQALIISIEIATDRWFAKGSNVQGFSLKNVIMQANNTITINGSKRINGQTWASQIHEITLYPTRAGNYSLPALNVDVSINTENDGIISGVLSTQEASFTIALPSGLVGIERFIVSPKVTLTIDGQFDDDKEYAVSEAITQTITITASDTPAMMIPEVNLINVSNKTNLAESTLNGISVYRKPAKVFDKSNRGSLTGSRIESFTYIFEKAGRYKLPEQIFYWWNSQTSTLEELVIPASSWTVSGGALTSIGQNKSKLSDIKFNLPTIIILIVTLFTLVLAYLLYSKRLQLIPIYKKVSNYEQRLVRKQFLNCVTKQEYLTASQYLYQYALTSGKHAQVKQWPLVKKLNQLAFQADSSQKITTNLSIGDAKALIKKIDTLTSKRVKHVNFKANETIKLNSE